MFGSKLSHLWLIFHRATNHNLIVEVAWVAAASMRQQLIGWIPANKWFACVVVVVALLAGVKQALRLRLMFAYNSATPDQNNEN